VNDLKATNVESLFGLMDEAITLLQTEAELSYVEALSETLENLSFEGKAQQVDGLPSDEAIERLNSLYKKMNLEALDKEIIRKSIQLTFIKATKEDKLQMNHQMTPDTIAYLIAYFIGEIKKDRTEKLHVSDLAAGTGNLLNIVLTHLASRGNEVTAEAVDNDDLLISVAANSGSLLGFSEKIHYTHSDSLQELLIAPSDIVVSDFPIGYYPVNERAENYKTAFSEGNSFAHFLMFEQNVNYLKESGWGIFIVPSDIFETDKSSVLMGWLKENVHIQAFLSLPADLFHKNGMKKSIIIVQKIGEKSIQAEQVLLGEIPDLKNAQKMQSFLDIFHNWSAKMI